jgi:hypothetical protein
MRLRLFVVEFTVTVTLSLALPQFIVYVVVVVMVPPLTVPDVPLTLPTLVIVQLPEPLHVSVGVHEFVQVGVFTLIEAVGVVTVTLADAAGPVPAAFEH